MGTCIRCRGSVIPATPPSFSPPSALVCKMGNNVAPMSQDNCADERDRAPRCSQSLGCMLSSAEELWFLLVPSSHVLALSSGPQPSWSQCGCQEPPLVLKSPPFHLGRVRAHDIARWSNVNSEVHPLGQVCLRATPVAPDPGVGSAHCLAGVGGTGRALLGNLRCAPAPLS